MELVNRSTEYKALHKEVTNSLRKARRGYRSLKNEGVTSPAINAFERKYKTSIDDLSLKDFNSSVDSLKQLKEQVDYYNSKTTRNISGYRNTLANSADKLGVKYERKSNLPKLMEKRRELRDKLYEYRKNTPSPVDNMSYTERDQYIFKTFEDNKLTEDDLFDSDKLDELIKEVSDRIDKQNELKGYW